MTRIDDRLAAALRTVQLPGSIDLLQSGRVAAARIDGGVASLILDVSGLSAAAREIIETKLKAAVGHLPSIGDVRIAFTEEKVNRTIIAIGSGKGGVGKSTVSANLAVALARTGRKVGLVDADIYGPSQPRIMGSHEKPEAINKQIIPVEAHGVRLLSIGQLVDPEAALAWRGPMASQALGQLLEGDWTDTEILIVDLPPGTGDVQLSLMQKWKPAGAVIVSTPQDLALIDARRAIDLFRKMHVPVLGLIENMAGFICPHCGEASDPFGSGGAEAAAKDLNLDFLGRIPLAMKIREASDAGMPPAVGSDEHARLFGDIARRVLERLDSRAG